MDPLRVLGFADYFFRHSDPQDPKHPPPEQFFSRLPYRTSRLRDNFFHHHTSKIIGDLGGHVPGKGHYVHWLMPECPPDLADTLSPIFSTLVAWDDNTKGVKWESSEEHRKHIRHALVSFFMLGECITIPGLDIVVAGLESLAKHDTRCLYDIFRSTQEVIEARSSSVDGITLEAYVELRSISSGLGVSLPILRAAHQIKVSQEEEASIAEIVNKASAIAGLTNDYYSFYKDHDEALRSGDRCKLRNGISVLMRGYMYSEDEAFQILKQEILAQEMKLMEMVQIWASVQLKSEGIRQLLALYLLTCGGSNYWSSINPSYPKPTNQEDRARFFGGFSRPPMVLPSYPPPKDSTCLVGHSGEVDPLLKSNMCFPLRSVPRSHIGSNNHQDMTCFLNPVSGPLNEGICLEPFKYVGGINTGNKYIHEFSRVINVWFRLPAHSIEHVDSIVSSTLTSVAMLNDVQDGSNIRHGQPVANLLYGEGQIMNSVIYGLIKATSLAHHANGNIVPLLLELLSDTIRGQALEIDWRGHAKCPTMAEYITMVDNKSASFFRYLLRFLEAESGIPRSPKLHHLVALLGRYMQIRKDYRNLVDEQYISRKGFCEDLDKGKFSLPLIHLFQNSSASTVVNRLMFRRPKGTSLTEQHKSFILSTMKSAGSLQYVASVLAQLNDEMLRCLEEVEIELGRNDPMRAMITAVRI